MYWPIGTPRIYRIAELQPCAKAWRTADSEQKSRKEGFYISENESGKTVSDHHADSGIDADQYEATINVSAVRKGQNFCTLTKSSITVWQSKPVVILASIKRSTSSLGKYGTNVGIALCQDSAVCIARTSLGYLIIYSLKTAPSTKIYKAKFAEDVTTHTKRQFSRGAQRFSEEALLQGPGEGVGTPNLIIQFKMIIRIDAGIVNAFNLQDELAIITKKPPALQCLQWAAHNSKPHTKTELFQQIPWIRNEISIVKITYDRAMSLSVWIGNDGTAYAAQRNHHPKPGENDLSQSMFNGFAFHEADSEGNQAIDNAINARFSLIAIACKNGEIWGYTVKDYTGGVSFSHKYSMDSSPLFSRNITLLSYSPDGNCLFVGFKDGWAMWSVYGKQLALNSASEFISESSNNGQWETSVRNAVWLGGGSELLVLSYAGNYLYVIDMARCILNNCSFTANPNHALLQTSSLLLVRKEQDVLASTALSANSPSWRQIGIPEDFLRTQWPIKLSTISLDGRYIAIAGRRGLAHFSVQSGRWKTFSSSGLENQFVVRGGMCWYDHFLLVAVETVISHEIRIYSRDQALDDSHIVFQEGLSSPVITMTLCSGDSLLVYSYDNVLRHYLILNESKAIKLHLVGQIAFNGIIKAPLRVRSISWLLPVEQIDQGDPSQDVSLAALLFLIDGKLISLRPSNTGDGDLKYQMKMVANNVEYFTLMNDNAGSLPTVEDQHETSDWYLQGSQEHQLSTSLWYFDGKMMHVRIGIDHDSDLVVADSHTEFSSTIEIAIDFYPMSIMRRAGILTGVESEISQRRDLNIVMFRNVLRTHLFLPSFLRRYIVNYNLPAAMKLSAKYGNLPYFPHVLEVLLHDILDEEVDSAFSSEDALLPRMLSYLSSFPYYRDVIVRCTRKTEARSWNTLFKYLPPPRQLFEESLEKGDLKIAGGYLIVSHTLENSNSGLQQSLRLFHRAKEAQDWELCKELSRFLMALDDSGESLRSVLKEIGLKIAQ